MIPVRLLIYHAFGMHDGVAWRDVELPAVFPGLELKCLFGEDDDGLRVVESVEYDFSDKRLNAWLKDDSFIEDGTTFAQLKSRGWFARWDTSDFEEHAAKYATPEARP